LLNFFEKINLNKLLKYLLFMFLSLILQNTIFTQLRLFGVCPLILPCVAAAVGLFQGPVFGAYFSLLMGIFGDMAFQEQTVLFTITLPCVAFAAAFVSQYFMNRSLFAYMGIALICSLAVGVVQMLAVMAGDTFSFSMVGTVILQALWSMPFAVLAYFPPAKWIKS
jgi:cell shape-determining protein MreD